MPSGPQVTLALGTGYLLGRRRKRKLLIMMGTAALAGGLGGPAGQLLRRGAKTAASSLGSADALGKVSPGLGEVAGLLRGDLAEAGKAAAMAAVNSRIDSLSEQLHNRADALRNPSPDAADTGGGEPGEGEDDGGERASRSPAASARPVRGTGRAAEDGRPTVPAQRRRDGAEGRRTAAARTQRTTGGAGSAAADRRPARNASAPPVRRAARPTSQE